MSTSTNPDPVSDPSRRTAMAPALGVMVVESNRWMRSRLCELLETEPGFRLAGVAAGAEEAMSMAERERFDIAVVGHRPPAESGFRLCRELKRPPAPPAVVICCAYPDGVLAACCAVADADALIGMHHCGANWPACSTALSAASASCPPCLRPSERCFETGSTPRSTPSLACCSPVSRPPTSRRR
jgi:CheY-like chemotaxis protein